MREEIVTLQFGEFSNYVGAHYWNLQAELLRLAEAGGGDAAASAAAAAARQLDAGVLFRDAPAAGPRTPRLLLFDASGALGGLPLDVAAEAPADAAGVATWGGAAEVHRAPPAPRSGFLQQRHLGADAGEYEGEEGEAEEEGGGGGGGEVGEAVAALTPLERAARALDAPGGVRAFTDFLSAPLHPRAAHLLPGVWRGDPVLRGWTDAGGAFAGGEAREGAAEGVRRLAEEADRLGGFQVFAEDLAAWGRGAAEVLGDLRDAYGPAAPVVLFALRPGGGNSSTGDEARARLAEGLSAAVLAPRCDVYVPVALPAHAALPALRWRGGDPYHEAAAVAAALDAATTPCRLAAGGGGAGRATAGELAALLAGRYRSPLAALAAALPCPALPADARAAGAAADPRVDHRHEGGGRAAAAPPPPFTAAAASFTPGLGAPAGDALCFAEAVSLRGPRAAGGGAAPLDAAAESLGCALRAEGGAERRERLVALTAAPLAPPLPFPPLFGPAVGPRGEWDGRAHGAPNGAGRRAAACPALARLAATAAWGPAAARAGARFRAAAASGAGRAALGAWGYADEDRDEFQERLERLAHAYEEQD
jgi:hypothetical protein